MLYPFTHLASAGNPQTLIPPLTIVSGSGIRLRDDQGREYIEAMSGLWCTGLGWANEELVEAAAKQMRDLSYYHCFAGRRLPVSEELAAKLIERAPARLKGGRVFFGVSGSDANDTQVKVVWHYNHVRNMPKKRKFIARRRAYHGVTVAASSLTCLPWLHKDMGLPLDFVRYVTCPSFYRDSLPGETEADFVARLSAELESAILEEGPDHVAAFIAEPLQGAGGVVIPPAGYFPAMRQVCDRHDVLMVADEVITGFGRTGNFWGCESFDQDPDMMSCAKLLTSGYIPLSAALIPARIYEEIEANSKRGGGIFGHGYTYTGHPVSCAVSLKVLEILERDRLVEHVRDVTGPLLQRRVRALLEHPLVGEARGIGLIGAVEIVADKATKASFPAARTAAAVVAACAQSLGLIVRPLPSDTVAFCPPLITTESDVNEIFDRFGAALDAAARKLA